MVFVRCAVRNKDDAPMDTVYPEPMSRLHRRAGRKHDQRACAGRYRTQPVTFQEIKEVDEENLEVEQQLVEPTAAAASKSEIDLNSKFEEFWRLGREKAKEKKKKRESSRDDSGVVTAAPMPVPRPPTPVTDADADVYDVMHPLGSLPSRCRTNPRTSI